MATALQVVRRTSMSKITKSYKNLTDEQMLKWEQLATHTAGQSVLGQKAQLSGINLYVRLNANRAMAGEELLADAPLSVVAVPNIIYDAVYVTPTLVAFTGIKHESSPYKLVVKMSAPQSPGISSGWSKTVIIAEGVEDDWGNVDVTAFYLKTLGLSPVKGQKVFIETYWLDTSTGFTGQVLKDAVVVVGEDESGYVPRKRVTMDRLDPEYEQHECKGNYLNIKKIGITVMVTVTPYVMSGEVTDYGLLPVMVWKKSRMCRMFLAILCGGLLLNSE